MQEVLDKIKNDFQNPIFEIKGVEFKVDKLNAWDAFPVAEKIRIALSKTMGKTSYEGEESFLTSIIAIPPEDLRSIRDDLFCKIYFRRQSKDNWCVLDGSEDSAFGPLDVADVYQVILRALAVNFSDTVL